jgi:hypothetical protein
VAGDLVRAKPGSDSQHKGSDLRAIIGGDPRPVDELVVDDFDVRRPERKSDVMEVQPTDDALDHAEKPLSAHV